MTIGKIIIGAVVAIGVVAAFSESTPSSKFRSKLKRAKFHMRSLPEGKRAEFEDALVRIMCKVDVEFGYETASRKVEELISSYPLTAQPTAA